jgi:prevent-host-death family protein
VYTSKKKRAVISSMIKAGIKETRKRLSHYLSRVQEGEEMIITKRDEPIARLVPIKMARAKQLTSHKGLRESIRAKGKPLSEIVIHSREESL